MTSQPRKQTISIHILRNISLSKDNQKMKFAKVIEYNMRIMQKMWQGEEFRTTFSF